MNGKQLRNSILQWAISGRLVPQDPNDEPALELLKRINPKATPITEEVPFTIPDSWVWCRLGSLCVFLSRGKSPKYSEERKYPVFAQKCNLKDGGISLEQARFLDPSTIDKWKEVYKLRNGDVLINSTGTGTVCRTRMFDEKCLGDYPFVVPDSHVSVVRTYEEINSTFVLYYISYRNTQQYLEDNLAGSTNQKELYIGVLENLLIPLPPLAEQERIVWKVGELLPLVERYDKAQTELDRLNASLKGKLRASVLQEAISGRLVPQDPTDEPASELLKRINPKAAPLSPDDAPFTLPNSWCWCMVGDIGNIITGSTPSKSIKDYYNGDIPFFKPTDLEQGINVCESGDHISELGYKQSRQLPPNSILVTCIGATIGKTGLTTVAGTCNQQINAIVPNNVVLPLYVYFACVSDCMQTKIKTNASATTLPILNKGNFARLPFPLPPLAEQERIVGKVEELFAVLDALH